MAMEKHLVETTGDNVEKAIEAGLKELGVTRDEVLTEILDEGSSGFLGIGARQAKVRIRLKEDMVTFPSDEVETKPIVGDTSEPAVIDEVSIGEIVDVEKSLDLGEFEAPVTGEPEGEEIGMEIVKNLLDKMGVEAEVSVRQTEPDDLTGEQRWVIDVHGQDLGVVIGPRGETLNALQYVARLMAGHAIRRRPTFIVDVEGYRSRREQALARLAERMAKKAIQRGRPVSLEPMPPNERRIIHLTLRQNADVYTESFGEGSRRKVRIFPKP